MIESKYIFFFLPENLNINLFLKVSIDFGLDRRNLLGSHNI